MKSKETGIRWNPRAPQAKIARLYRNEAQGLLEESLVDDVGLSLFLRCQSILIVSARQVICPQCQHLFATGWRWHKRNDTQVTRCPACQQWEITGKQYLDSFQQDALAAEGALESMRAFTEAYPGAREARVKVLLIDQLLHAFHWGLRQTAIPHRSAANNLIEETHEEIAAFLDGLTYGERSAPESQQRKAAWRITAQEMMRLRQRGRQREFGGDCPPTGILAIFCGQCNHFARLPVREGGCGNKPLYSNLAERHA